MTNSPIEAKAQSKADSKLVRAYKVMLGFYQDLEVTDHFPVDDIYSGLLKGLLDVASPFYTVVKADFEVVYTEIDDSLEPEWLKLQSSLQVKALGTTRLQKDFGIELNQDGIAGFTVSSNGVEKKYTCEVL